MSDFLAHSSIMLFVIYGSLYSCVYHLTMAHSIYFFIYRLGSLLHCVFSACVVHSFVLLFLHIWFIHLCCSSADMAHSFILVHSCILLIITIDSLKLLFSLSFWHLRKSYKTNLGATQD